MEFIDWEMESSGGGDVVEVGGDSPRQGRLSGTFELWNFERKSDIFHLAWG